MPSYHHRFDWALAVSPNGLAKSWFQSDHGCTQHTVVCSPAFVQEWVTGLPECQAQSKMHVNCKRLLTDHLWVTWPANRPASLLAGPFGQRIRVGFTESTLYICLDNMKPAQITWIPMHNRWHGDGEWRKCRVWWTLHIYFLFSFSFTVFFSRRDSNGTWPVFWTRTTIHKLDTI